MGGNKEIAMYENKQENAIHRNMVLDQAYHEADGVLSHEIIEPRQFSHLYKADMIKADNEYVDRRNAEIEENSDPEQERIKKIATAFEAILYQESELSAWLGENVVTINASEFDKFKNGVDTIAEFHEETGTSHLAMGIDVTFSTDLENKFNRIKKSIDDGELTEIRYFYSKDTGFMGQLNMVPEVIIGAEFKTIEELIDLWLERGNKKALGEHQIQFQILEQILIQLKAFEEYASSIGKFEIAARYGKAIKLVEKIYYDKQGSLVDNGTRDSVFYAIKENLKKFS